jgi:hypothetical protein
MMAVNKPVGDNARKGAVKKRTRLKNRLGGATAWTKRSKTSGEFMAVKKAGSEEKGRQKVQRASGGSGDQRRPAAGRSASGTGRSRTSLAL